MRVLVAGGAGFVGSNLCAALVESGHEVTGLDNLLTGSRSNVADLERLPNFRLLVCDAVAAPDMRVDVVLHLASPASPVHYQRYPLETLDVNSNGTRRLLEIASASSARFVYASTSEIYGDPLVHPQAESYWGNVDPVGPRSCYDEAKRFGEALVTAWRRQHGVHAAIVRIFNTYGPGMRMDDGRVVPELLHAALAGNPLVIHGDGQQTRSFMYVDDLVAALSLVAVDGGLDGLILNVGNPEEVTIADLATRIAAASRTRAEIVNVGARFGDPQRRKPDISRVEARYQWRPRVTLDDGLTRTVRWLQARRTQDQPTSDPKGVLA